QEVLGVFGRNVVAPQGAPEAGGDRPPQPQGGLGVGGGGGGRVGQAPQPGLFSRGGGNFVWRQKLAHPGGAPSDNIDGCQAGSQTSSTSAEVTPGAPATLSWTSPGRLPATGQPGAVSVILTLTAPSSWMSMS